MSWYAASIIMLTKFKDGIQDKYPVWENVILIEGNSPDEASEKALARAREDEGDSAGTYLWEDRPASGLCRNPQGHSVSEFGRETE